MSALLHALCKRGHCIPVTLMSAIERCTYCREVLVSGQPCVHASNANTTRRDAADPAACLDAQPVLRSARSKSVLIVENVARYFTDSRWVAAVSDLCHDGWVVLTGSRGSGAGGTDALRAAMDTGAAKSRTRHIFVAVRSQLLPRPRMRHESALTTSSSKSAWATSTPRVSSAHELP